MTPAGEFSHQVTVDPWPEEDVTVELTATADERNALRARFDLVDLPSLDASVQIEKTAMEWVLTGTIDALVAQTCVVTLQPVTASLNVPFERRYCRKEAHDRLIAAGKTEADDGEMLDIDILEGSEIDVGEVVAEELYLALDPYPRVPDADRALADMKTKTGTDEHEGRANPFEKLRPH